MSNNTLSFRDFLASSEFWAAFAGAAAAFSFEWARSWFAHGRDQQDAVNSVLVSLSQMYNELQGLFLTVYEETDKKARQTGRTEARPYEVPPVSSIRERAPRLDLPKLAFLLRTHDPDILNRVNAVDAFYAHVFVVEVERSRVHLQIQERISAAGFREGQQIAELQIAEAAGPANWRQLQIITTEQRQNLKRAIEGVLKARTELVEVASLYLPARSLLIFKTKEEVIGDEKRPAAFWRYWLRAIFRALRKAARKQLI